MFLYVFYSPFLAPVIICAVAPGYVAAFWLWSWACARYPWLDRGWKPTFTFAGVVSLVLAIPAAAICARGPLGVPRFELFTWLPFCLAVFWGAIVVPRWLLDFLQQGRFSEPLCEVMVHDV